MEEQKVTYNDSTDQRPEGERILNAPLVHIDVKEKVKAIKKESTWKDSDRNSMTIYKNESMRLVLIALHKDAVLQRHTANGNISVQVLDGKIEFSTDEQSMILEEMDMIALHRGIPHEVKAIKESVFLLTMHPEKD